MTNEYNQPLKAGSAILQYLLEKQPWNLLVGILRRILTWVLRFVSIGFLIIENNICYFFFNAVKRFLLLVSAFFFHKYGLIKFSCTFLKLLSCSILRRLQRELKILESVFGNEL